MCDIAHRRMRPRHAIPATPSVLGVYRRVSRPPSIAMTARRRAPATSSSSASGLPIAPARACNCAQRDHPESRRSEEPDDHSRGSLPSGSACGTCKCVYPSSCIGQALKVMLGSRCFRGVGRFQLGVRLGRFGELLGVGCGARAVDMGFGRRSGRSGRSVSLGPFGGRAGWATTCCG
jgi:hypothetical protein